MLSRLHYARDIIITRIIIVIITDLQRAVLFRDAHSAATARVSAPGVTGNGIGDAKLVFRLTIVPYDIIIYTLNAAATAIIVDAMTTTSVGSRAAIINDVIIIMCTLARQVSCVDRPYFAPRQR